MGKHWSGNYRAPWHDYTRRQIYHITLMKSPEAPPFGALAGSWRLPAGTPGRSYIQASPTGRAVKDCLRAFPTIHPALKVLQYALMPDHLHLILFATAPLDEILGRKIAAFKVMVNKRCNHCGIFAQGFNDQIISPGRNLATLFNYLRDNHFRLDVRRSNPQFFCRVNRIAIGGITYATYGNYQLLSNPFKEQVVVHRADTPAQLTAHKAHWMYTAANGGILVSPFISAREKAIRAEAEALGGKTILITSETFGSDRYKPSAHDFDLCAQGRLLIISLGLPAGTPLRRHACLQMNTLANTVATIPATKF